MKRIILPVVAIATFLVSCGPCANYNSNFPVLPETENQDEHGHGHSSAEYFGTKIDEHGALSAEAIMNKLANADSLTNVKMEATIEKVCQMKGCWMTLVADGDAPIRVTFKDYAFFVPKDAAGKKAVVQGVAYKEVLTVDMLKHYAEDAGKSKEEIAAITEPKTEYTFEAEGVIIK
ncbi:MAG TPA: DUF4920 domain-containing protein [Bacteroidia bacterium]